MELLKQNIHMDRIKCLAGTQVTLENDVNIPDNRPDAESVILSKGMIVVDDIRASDNHVFLKGKLLFSLLIQSEMGGLYAVNGEIPFEEQVYMEGITANDTADIVSSLEDMSVSLINSRKLSVQAVVGFKLCVDTLWDVDPAKVGKDAGEIFGYEKAGIIVTDDREAVLNTEADAVLYYTPQMYDSPIMTQEHLTPTCDEICEILSHKKNLITTVCLYHSKKKAPAILTLKDIFRNTETFSLQVPHPA